MRRSKAWLAILWFFEHGVAINGWKLHELSGIAPSSAFNLLKKFATIIQAELPEDAECVPSALFSDTFTKRSRATPAGKHPRSEEEAVARTQDNDSAKLDTDTTSSHTHNRADTALASSAECSNTENANLPGREGPDIEDDNQRKIYSLLSNEPTHFDALCYKTELPSGTLASALVMLELEGLIERQVGEYYISKAGSKATSCLQFGESTPISPQVAERACEIISFISATWRGISRKYLQNYLGVFWYITASTRGDRDRLFTACLRSGPIRRKQFLSYLTPVMVRIGWSE
jgi:hypothetical protein